MRALKRRWRKRRLRKYERLNWALDLIVYDNNIKGWQKPRELKRFRTELGLRFYIHWAIFALNENSLHLKAFAWDMWPQAVRLQMRRVDTGQIIG